MSVQTTYNKSLPLQYNKLALPPQLFPPYPNPFLSSQCSTTHISNPAASPSLMLSTNGFLQLPPSLSIPMIRPIL